MKLTQEQINSIIPHIKNVLQNGGEWSDYNLHLPVGPLIKEVAKIKGLKTAARIEPNGWSYDWCLECFYKNNIYTLTGSGYDGGHSFIEGD